METELSEGMRTNLFQVTFLLEVFLLMSSSAGCQSTVQQKVSKVVPQLEDSDSLNDEEKIV